MLSTSDEAILIDTEEAVEDCTVEVGTVDVDSTGTGVDTGTELARGWLLVENGVNAETDELRRTVLKALEREELLVGKMVDATILFVDEELEGMRPFVCDTRLELV